MSKPFVAENPAVIVAKVLDEAAGLERASAVGSPDGNLGKTFLAG